MASVKVAFYLLRFWSWSLIVPLSLFDRFCLSHFVNFRFHFVNGKAGTAKMTEERNETKRKKNEIKMQIGKTMFWDVRSCERVWVVFVFESNENDTWELCVFLSALVFCRAHSETIKTKETEKNWFTQVAEALPRRFWSSFGFFGRSSVSIN